MKLIKGKNLNDEQKQQVLRMYVHRLTVENNYPAINPCGARVKPITDKQWLKEHAFYVCNNGDLSQKHNHCEPAFLAD